MGEREEIRIEPGRAVIGGTIALSFQRYPEPLAARVSQPPRSFGALACAKLDERTILVPVTTGEAFWIAMEIDEGAAQSEVVLSFDLGRGHFRDQVLRFNLPPNCAVDGLSTPDGSFAPIVRTSEVPGRAQCSRIFLSLVRRGAQGHRLKDVVNIELTSPATFRDVTGCDPGPSLDPADAYDGRLLP